MDRGVWEVGVELRLLSQPGGEVWVADAPNWINCASRDSLLIGISTKGVNNRARRGDRTQIGQMFEVLGTGMILAQNVYRGLRRDMFVGEDRLADQKKLAISWKANHDAYFAGDPNIDGHVIRKPAPPNSVFVVYVSVNEMLDDFPQIYGWAEHWTWVREDPRAPGLPVESETRYDELVWRRDPKVTGSM